MSQLEKEISILVKTVSGKNLDKNTGSTIQQNSKSTICDLCNARFRSAEELVNHKQSLHTEDTQACKLCGFMNTTNIKMRAHMVSKHTFKICHLCEETFINAEQHKKHFEQIHVDPDDQDLNTLFDHYLEDDKI